MKAKGGRGGKGRRKGKERDPPPYFVPQVPSLLTSPLFLNYQNLTPESHISSLHENLLRVRHRQKRRQGHPFRYSRYQLVHIVLTIIKYGMIRAGKWL